MKHFFKKSKKGVLSQFWIWLILGIIILSLYLWHAGLTYQDLYKNPKILAEETESAYANLMGTETQKEEELRTKQEKNFLDFDKQITTLINNCLEATNAPCLCVLEKPQNFVQNYQLTLEQQEKTYYSIPEELQEDKGSIILTNPSALSTKKPFKFYDYTSNQETKKFSFSLEGKQFQITTEQGTQSLGEKNLRLYKTAKNNLYFIPEGTPSPTPQNKKLSQCIS